MWCMRGSHGIGTPFKLLFYFCVYRFEFSLENQIDDLEQQLVESKEKENSERTKRINMEVEYSALKNTMGILETQLNSMKEIIDKNKDVVEMFSARLRKNNKND